MVKKEVDQGHFREIKPLQIVPENAGNRISVVLKLKIFRGSMPPDPQEANSFGGRLSESPLPEILDPPQVIHFLIMN